MIETYVSPTGRGGDQTTFQDYVAAVRDKAVTKWQAAEGAGSCEREEQLHPAIVETLTETRKKQYAIIQELRALQAGLNGDPFPDEAIEEWHGLVELTWQIADANDAIARLVKDCREMIGKPASQWQIGQLRKYCDVIGCPLEEALEAAAK